jgi:hypothetical protein
MADDGVMLIETAVLVDDNRHALMYCPTGDESPYESTCVTFFNRKGLHDTLASLGFRVGDSQCLMNLTAPRASALPDKPAIDRCLTFCFKTAVHTLANNYWHAGPKPPGQDTWHGPVRRPA